MRLPERISKFRDSIEDENVLEEVMERLMEQVPAFKELKEIVLNKNENFSTGLFEVRIEKHIDDHPILLYLQEYSPNTFAYIYPLPGGNFKIDEETYYKAYFYIPISKDLESDWRSENYEKVIVDTLKTLKGCINGTEFGKYVVRLDLACEKPIVQKSFGQPGAWIEFELVYRHYNSFWINSFYNIDEFQAADVLIYVNEYGLAISHESSKNKYNEIITKTKDLLETYKSKGLVEDYYEYQLKINQRWIADHLVNQGDISKKSKPREIVDKLVSINGLFKRLNISMNMIRNSLFYSEERYDIDAIRRLMSIKRIEKLDYVFKNKIRQ